MRSTTTTFASSTRLAGLVLGLLLAGMLSVDGASAEGPGYCEDDICDPETEWLCELDPGSLMNCRVNAPGSDDPCTVRECEPEVE